MSQDRVEGFVVGPKNNGKKMVVRVKDSRSLLNDKKLTVSSVAYGAELTPKQDVSFVPDATGKFALDVQVLPQAEATTKTLAVVDEPDDVRIAVRQQPSGDIYLALSPFFSRVDDQRELISAGSDEVVLDFLTFVPPNDGGTIAVIQALSGMEGCFLETLESLLTAAFELGQKHHKPQP